MHRKKISDALTSAGLRPFYAAGHLYLPADLTTIAATQANANAVQVPEGWWALEQDHSLVCLEQAPLEVLSYGNGRWWGVMADGLVLSGRMQTRGLALARLDEILQGAWESIMAPLVPNPDTRRYQHALRTCFEGLL